MTVDCKALDKKQDDAKWAARAASTDEFGAMDKMEAEADQIKAVSGKTGGDMTNEEIIDGQIDLIETAKQEKADQIKALTDDWSDAHEAGAPRDDWSDAHGAGAGNGKTGDRIDALKREIEGYDKYEQRLNGLVDDYAKARAKHDNLEDDYEELLDEWDEHCAPDAGQ
jgi:hypothetical protein